MSGAPILVRAAVVDLRGDDPRSDDAFWVDTQIWLTLAYARVPCPPHLKDYTRYIKRAREAKAQLVAGAIHTAELARCVEHAEKQIYEESTGASHGGAEMSIKAFRCIATARAAAVVQIDSAWRILTSLATLTTAAISPADVRARHHASRYASARPWSRSGDAPHAPRTCRCRIGSGVDAGCSCRAKRTRCVSRRARIA